MQMPMLMMLALPLMLMLDTSEVVAHVAPDNSNADTSMPNVACHFAGAYDVLMLLLPQLSLALSYSILVLAAYGSCMSYRVAYNQKYPLQCCKGLVRLQEMTMEVLSVVKGLTGSPTIEQSDFILETIVTRTW